MDSTNLKFESWSSYRLEDLKLKNLISCKTVQIFDYFYLFWPHGKNSKKQYIFIGNQIIELEILWSISRSRFKSQICAIYHHFQEKLFFNVNFSESVPERKNKQQSKCYKVTYPWLHKFFMLGSSFGDEIFYITYLPLIYWCFEHFTGARIVQVSLWSLWFVFEDFCRFG